MKRKIFILSAVIAAAITVPRTFAAVPVYDAANTAETHATFLQAAQQVLNSGTQIANQGLELTSMSDSSLDAHAKTVNSEMSFAQKVLNQLGGMMSPGKTSDQAWSETFKPIDDYYALSDIITPMAVMTNNQKMSHALDQTLQDGLKVAKAYADITQDTALLEELQKQNKKAVGNKHAAQVQNDLIAQQNAIYIKQNQIMAAMATSMIAANARQNQMDAQSNAINKAYSDALDETINAPRTKIAESVGVFP